ncbi:DivIVA domain-containing protein [Cellulomonas sp. ICMP 17802]|uniref:DivIVA domain-containing protein n=1 Tax=Cellulomonas sp. ICMP 17802 TaxID=3239199 RepID=UPI00351B5E2D
MLSADQVLNQKFAATKFREGYDQDEVDDFLDRVAETVRELEGGAHASRPVTAQEVGGIRFAATKWREGYDQREVDDFLDRVRERLASPAPAPTEAPAWQPNPVDAPLFPPSTIGARPAAISASALVTRLQMARATRPVGAPDAVAVRLPDGTVHPVVDLASTADGVELVLG